MRKLTYWLVGLVLIGVAVGAVLLLNNIREIAWQAAENASCEATVSDQGGVDINSAFRFVFEDDVSANAVRRFLSVEPAVELNYHQGLQAREVLAVPLEPLQPGTVYRFSLATERETLSWAFQTKREWRVERSDPTYAELGVVASAPLNLYLNQSLSVDITNIEEYFQISPHIDGHMEQDGNCLRFVPQQPWAEGTVYTVRLLAGLPAVGSDITLAEDYTVAFETMGGVAVGKHWQIAGMNLQFKPGQAPVFTCFLPEPLPAAQPVTPPDNQQVTPPDTTTVVPPAPEQPKISTALYQYADSAAYANDLLAWLESAPVWSTAHNYAQGATTEGLTWLGYQELAVEDGSFNWPNALVPGYYLLQATYQGQSRDIRFQVSELNAFVQATSGGSLLWAHESAGGLPLPEYTVTYINDGQQAQADEQGIALLNRERQLPLVGGVASALMLRYDVYLLQQGERSLVLAQHPGLSMLAGSADMWQYLRLSKQSYNSGDTVDFWGYMRKREGGDWEWSRVTVHVCAVDAPDEPVVQGYAPLSNNIFSGSVELPHLLAGRYELQIWQSGQQLLSREFLVDSVVIGAADGLTDIYVAEEPTPLSSDKAAYALNEGYTISWPEAGESSGGYLFFKQVSGLTEAVVEPQALHHGVFGLEDAGSAPWRAVSYANGRYQASAPINLALDSSVYSLNVQLENRDKASREQGETVIGITVRDTAGAVPARAGVLALIGPPGLDMGNILAEMYSPRNLGHGAESFSAQPEGAEQAQVFTALELDKNGQAELTFTVPPGEWRLYVWAVADGLLPLAGQSSISFITNSGITGGQVDKPAPPALEARNNEAAPVFWATRYDISSGSSHFIHKGLLYFSSQERVQAMELLWQPLFSANTTVEQSLGHAYARLLWQRYGYADFSLPLPPVEADSLSALQQPDGGIAAAEQGQPDLFVSMRVAALARDGMADMFDTAALARYLQGQVYSGAAEQRAMALAGLAALGKPVLQDIKLLLAQEWQTPYSRAALIWGLAQAGDTQVAKAAFHDFWGAYASDSTSGSAYLEGGQGQNIDLNRLGALAAAACGEARTSFVLLQYLGGQQEYDDLSTALICGGLLSSLYANPASASLTYFLAPEAGESASKDGRAYEVEIGAFNDAWQEYMLPGNLLVDAAQGDIAMTCLRVE